MAYGVFIKRAQSRATPMEGPFSFPSTEERKAFVMDGLNVVYWFHDVEEDDWTLWKRGGGWAATATPGPADRIPEKPEITEEDRW